MDCLTVLSRCQWAKVTFRLDRGVPLTIRLKKKVISAIQTATRLHGTPLFFTLISKQNKASLARRRIPGGPRLRITFIRFSSDDPEPIAISTVINISYIVKISAGQPTVCEHDPSVLLATFRGANCTGCRVYNIRAGFLALAFANHG